MNVKPSVAQQGPWADLGADFQQALRQEWHPAQPLQVRCAVREQTLLVLVEHLLHVEPNPEAAFGSLEQTLRQIVSDGQMLQTKPASLGVDQLPVQLFLRIAGYQQPYASRQFAIDLKPPAPATPVAPSVLPLSELAVAPVSDLEANPSVVSGEPSAPVSPPAAPDSSAPDFSPADVSIADLRPEPVEGPETETGVIPEPPIAELLVADSELRADSKPAAEPAIASISNETVTALSVDVPTIELETSATIPPLEVSPEASPEAVQETIAIEHSELEPVSEYSPVAEPVETGSTTDLPAPVIEPEVVTEPEAVTEPTVETEAEPEAVAEPAIEPEIEVEPEAVAEPGIETGLLQSEILETPPEVLAADQILDGPLSTETLAVPSPETLDSFVSPELIQPSEVSEVVSPQPLQAKASEIQAEQLAAEPISEPLPLVEENALESAVEPGLVEPELTADSLEHPPSIGPIELLQPEPVAAEPEPALETELQIEASAPSDRVENLVPIEPLVPELGSERLSAEPSAIEPVSESPEIASEVVEPSTVELTPSFFKEIRLEGTEIASELISKDSAETAQEEFVADVVEFDSVSTSEDDQITQPLIAEPDVTPDHHEELVDVPASEAPAATEVAALSPEPIVEAEPAELPVEEPMLSESVLPEDSVDISTADIPLAGALDDSDSARSDQIQISELTPLVEVTPGEPEIAAEDHQAVNEAVVESDIAVETGTVDAATDEATVEAQPQPLQPQTSVPIEPPLTPIDATPKVTVAEPRRFRWSASSLTLAGAIAGFLIASGFYMLTRPCVLGACEPLQRAERLGQEAIQTAQTTDSSLAVVEAYGKLNEASYLLGTIPAWSRYHSTAQSLLNRYEDQSVVLGQVVKALEQANDAAQRSQNPPHPLQTWREIQWQWRDVISQLEKIPPNHSLYGLVQRKLTEYRANLTDINQRVAIEQQAQDRISAARKLEQTATGRAKAAKTPANWQETATLWTQAIEQLRQVPQGTMPYDEAQQLLAIYQPKLAEANARRVQEQGGAEAYSQALRFGQQAEALEQQNQWTQAVDAWQSALSYAQQVPTSTSYYSQIQPLINTYTQSLQQAQQNAQRSVALQTIRPTLDRTCGGSPQRCTFTLSPQSIRVQFTAIYDKTVATLIAKANPSTETNLPPAIVDQVNELLRNLADVGNITQTPIELYDADGAKLGTYTPELSGYVPQ